MTRSPNHCCHVIQQYLLCVLMSDMALSAMQCYVPIKALLMVYHL
jgi:hypothetical protein